ncbi:ubiquitin-like FUBI-ribosomal protein eS30 fusion protein [Trichechus inunguis]
MRLTASIEDHAHSHSFLFFHPNFEVTAVGGHISATSMQLFVCSQELHTLVVTGQKTVAQIKARTAWLEGIAPEDQVVLLSGTPLEDEANLGQCRAEALTILEVAGLMLGGKVHASLACTGKVRLPRWSNRRGRTRRLADWMQYNWHFVNVALTFGHNIVNS